MASSTTADILLTISKYLPYSTYVIFTAAIIGNVFNILVFSTLKVFRNNQCVIYFTTESIANILALIPFVLIRLFADIYPTDPANSVLFWCKFRVVMVGLGTITAFSTICFSAFDQYLSTNHQVYIRQMSTIKLARNLIIIGICISILQGILFGIFFEIRSSVCAVFNPNMSQYISFFYYLILSAILPIFISSLFSILAYRNVRRIIRRQIAIVRRRLDRQLTAMVLIRVIIFVILTLPYDIVRMYAYIVQVDQSNLLSYAIYILLLQIANILYYSNFAISFYLFLASSSRYRRQVKHFIIRKCWRRWKRWCSCNENQVHPNMEVGSNESSRELE